MKLLDKILFYFGIIIFFLTPIFFTDIGVYIGLDSLSLGTWQTYQLPKVLFLFFTIGIWLILFVINYYLESRIKTSKTMYLERNIMYLLGGFLLLYNLANLFSPLFPSTLFGTVVRANGLIIFNLILVFNFLFVFKYLFFFKFRNHLYWGIITSGILVSFIALLQYLDLDPIEKIYNTDFLLGRVFSTLGNPNYLATYLLFLFPVSVLVTKNNYKTRISLLSLFTLVMLLTGSRAGLLGIVVFGILYSLVILKLRNFKIKKAYIGLSILGVAIMLFISPIGDRLVPNQDNLRSLGTRFELWETGKNLIFERPILGWGSDTLYSTYLRVQRPEILRFEKLNDKPDRLHNHFFDLAYESGIPATIIYFLFLSFLFYSAFHSKSNEAKILSIGLISIIVCDLFGFFLITHKLYFWLFIYIIILQVAVKIGEVKPVFKVRPIVINAVIIMFGVISFSISLFWWKAEKFIYASNQSEELINIENALELWPYGLEYYSSYFNHDEVDVVNFEKKLNYFSYLRGGEDVLYYITLIHRNDVGENRKRLAFEEGLKLAPYYPPLWIAYLRHLRSTDLESFKKTMPEFLEFLPDTWNLKYKENLNEEEENRLRLFKKHNPLLMEMIQFYQLLI